MKKGGIFMRIKKSIKQMAEDFKLKRRPIKVRKGKQVGYGKKEHNPNGKIDMLIGTEIIK